MSNLIRKPFTSESAREAGRKSWKARTEREEQGRRALELIANMPISASDVRASRLAKQMDLIESAMIKEKDSKELANLSAAHARLFSAWCVLTGTKSPGTLGKTRRERPAPIQPISPLDNQMSNPTQSPPPAPGQPRSEDCTG